MAKAKKTSLSACLNSFSVLNAGQNSVPTGTHHKIKIGEEVWNADFSYWAQPANDRQALIRASFRVPEMTELPEGTALLSCSGVILGKKAFALSGQEGTLDLGSDPQITITSHLVSKQHCNSDNEDKIYSRKWRYKAHNAHAFPVRLKLEEARPVSTDKRIMITFETDPPLSVQKKDSLIWDLELAAGETKAIQFGVKVEAPADLEVNF